MNARAPNKNSILVLAASVLVSCFLGAILARAFWNHLQLPYSDPYDVIGPVRDRGFNPTNNTLRYILAAVLPSVCFLVCFLVPRIRKHLENLGLEVSAFLQPGSIKKVPYAVWAAVIALTLLGAIFSIDLLYACLAVRPIGQIDNYHVGEVFMPVWQHAFNGGFWTSNVISHGLGFNYGLTALGWKLFGESFGSGRLMEVFFDRFVYLTAALCLFGASGSLRDYASRSEKMLFFLISTMFFLAASDSILMTRRDLILLVSLAMSLWAFSRPQPIWMIAIGLIGVLNLLWSFDRGFFLLIALVLTLVAKSLFFDFKEGSRQFLSLLVGVGIGFLGMIAVFGYDEFRAFGFDSLFRAFSRPYFDSNVYPRIGWSAPSTTMPVLAIAGLLLSLLIGYLTIYRRQRDLRFLGYQHCFLVFMSFLAFRSAIDNPDEGHLKHSSYVLALTGAWICGVVGIFVFRLYEKHARMAMRVVLPVSLMIGLACVVHSKRAEISAIPRGHSVTLRQVLDAPKETFLPEPSRQVYPQLREMFKNESCVLTLSAEAVLPYFLDKPSCTRFYIALFASPKPSRFEILEEMRNKRPCHVITDSTYWASKFGGIRNVDRLPELKAYIKEHYTVQVPLQNYEIFKRPDC